MLIEDFVCGRLINEHYAIVLNKNLCRIILEHRLMNRVRHYWNNFIPEVLRRGYIHMILGNVISKTSYLKAINVAVLINSNLIRIVIPI